MILRDGGMIEVCWEILIPKLEAPESSGLFFNMWEKNHMSYGFLTGYG